MLVRRSHEGENPYRKTIIHKTKTTNQDSSDEEDIQMGEIFQNEQAFFFFMNEKLDKKTDLTKKLGC